MNIALTSRTGGGALSLIFFAIFFLFAIPAHGATFTVDSTSDGTDSNAGNGSCDDGGGNCTLRAAIEEANALAGTDTINFSITGAGPHTISPGSNYPSITEAVILDASTEPDSSCGDLWAGTAPTLNIIVDGGSARGFAFTVTAGSSTVKGFHLQNFTGPAITLTTSGNNTVQCNHAEDSGTGVSLTNIDSNTIGGATAGEGNIFSGNTGGIDITGGDSNVVRGNFVGTSTTGSAADGNTNNGLQIEDTTNLTIGGTASGAGNLISGNTSNGLSLTGGSLATTIIQGNYIGLNRAGTAAIANGISGIRSDDGTGLTIGGTTSSARNIVSGNPGNGISLSGSQSGTIIRGNYVGLNATGAAAIANGAKGIEVTGGSATIGGTDSGAGNIISGNTGAGINASGTSITIQGNYIGLNAAGTTAVGNGDSGVSLGSGATNIVVGGTTAAARNIISGNTGAFKAGVIYSSSGAGNVVEGNYIGTDSTGNVAVANTIGVLISNDSLTVGGTSTAERNIISGNTTAGIAVVDLGGTPSGITIQGNYIGVGADGNTALGSTYGIVLTGGGVANNMIGGTASGAGNVIANNTNEGISTFDFSTIIGTDVGTGNAFLGNSIYNNSMLGIDLALNAGPTGVTTNDEDDPDTGPNNFQNYPVLTNVTLVGSTLTVSGTLGSLASQSYRLEFFANSGQDPTGFGEGETYLGATTVSTDTDGSASFTFTLTDGLPAGVTTSSSISATASQDLGGGNYSTSEFSSAVLVGSGSGGGGGGSNIFIPINPTLTLNEGASETSNPTINVLLTGSAIDAYRLSFDPTFSTSDWQLFTERETSTVVVLPEIDGEYTVYAQFRSAHGITETVEAPISLRLPVGDPAEESSGDGSDISGAEEGQAGESTQTPLDETMGNEGGSTDSGAINDGAQAGVVLQCPEPLFHALIPDDCNRDIEAERAMLGVFRDLYGHLPESTLDWHRHHYLTYGGTWRDRDIDAERAVQPEFEDRYGRLPQSALDWLILHLIAYP